MTRLHDVQRFGQSIWYDNIRRALLTSGGLQRYHLPNTLGYGPRFLPSTGQLHKGGANNGLFIEVTADDTEDLAVPGEPYTFSTLKMAQALGDFQSLVDKNRRVVRFHIGKAVDRDPNCLDALRAWIAIVSAESGKAQALSELDYVGIRHPKAWGPYCALAEWMMSTGDREGAEKYGKLALEREAAEPVVSLMSAVLGNAGKLQDLVAVVEAARPNGKAGIPAMLNLAQAHAALGSLSKARECVDDARKRADREWLPAIHDLQQRLTPRTK